MVNYFVTHKSKFHFLVSRTEVWYILSKANILIILFKFSRTFYSIYDLLDVNCKKNLIKHKIREEYDLNNYQDTVLSCLKNITQV